MAQKIRVLIADDSAFMRKIISDMVNSDPCLEVIATARNGIEAIEKAEKLRPDVITMDIEMPKMDGLSALEQIINKLSIPIIMFSSLTKEGAQITLTALEKGAFDFVPKPDNVFLNRIDQVRDDLLEKIKAASRANLNNLKRLLPVSNAGSFRENDDTCRTIKRGADVYRKVVAIGASTGGPRALQEVLPALPKDINAAILVVQHMPPNFTKSLSERLDSLSKIEVKEAESGDELRAGRALIAPGNYHMIVRKKSNGLYCIELNQESPFEGHRPSVTVMMRSVAENFASKAIGVVLTGMGGDGSDGAVEIKRHKGSTIVEDESTCVVFGMPKAVIRKNAADYVAPLPKVAEHILKML